ncbi:MAG: thioredoxin [Candidatus Omnitrophota bacterium]|nr:MAG: thioredoxin [Candidatus Omnitrophota bacterium]
MSKEVVNLNSESFDKFLQENEVAVVDFWAVWCMPCLMVAPIMENLAKKYEGKIAFGKVNVDEERDIAMRFGIMSIPTIIIFKDGKMVDQIVGAMPEKILEEKLLEATSR